MGQMATSGQRHAEDRVARLEQRDEYGLVRLRPGVRLRIDKAATEEPLAASIAKLSAISTNSQPP